MSSNLKKQSLKVCAAAIALILAGSVQAQSNVKPPKLQLWIDVSTGGMAGMPEMEMPAGMGGMMQGLGGMMGGASGAPGGTGGFGTPTAYGQARGMAILPARIIDIALWNSLRPGVEAKQNIPAGMRMGESLPLVPPKPAGVREYDSSETPRDVEQPKGRILIYWGCGETVRAGQPRIIDLAKLTAANAASFGSSLAGRYAPDRGARVNEKYALYPNEKNRVMLSKDSSLMGEHRVVGDGIPASMKFTLGAAQDLMPVINLQTSGSLQTAIMASWQPVTNTKAYYLNAMGMTGDDMVLWSSAETGDTGMGLFDYLPGATIDKWLRENVLLQPAVTRCAIPKGIFDASGGGRKKEGGAMLRMIAYGPESNFAYPARPADPKAVWEPEWAVRVRVKAQTMAALGEENMNAGYKGSQGMEQESAAPASEETAPSPVKVLKGIFGF